MCGRIACGLKHEQICEISNAKDTGNNKDKYKSSYNVAPTRYIPIVYSKKQYKLVEKPVEVKEVKVEVSAPVKEEPQNTNIIPGLGGFNRRMRNEVKVELFTTNEEEELKYNLPRQQNVIYYSVLKEHEETNSEVISQEISFEPMKWGTNLNKYPVINIRQESLCFVPYYRKMLQKKNFCVTIVSGYFEWKEIAEGVKQPFYITSKDKYLILASLYDDFSDTEEKKVVIITQDANPYLSFVHSRMPVILNLDEMQKMIKATSIREYYSILNEVMKNNKNLDKEFLEFYPVGNLVNKLANEDESVIINKKDVEKDKDGNFTLKAFLKKNKISVEDKKPDKLINLKSEEEKLMDNEIKKSLELFENVKNAKQLDKVIKKICVDSFDSDIDEEKEIKNTQNNKKNRNTQTLTQKFGKSSKVDINSKKSQSKDSKGKNESKGKSKPSQSKDKEKDNKTNNRSKSKKSQKEKEKENIKDKGKTQNNKNKTQKNKENKKSYGNLDSFVSSSKKSKDYNSSKDI